MKFAITSYSVISENGNGCQFWTLSSLILVLWYLT